MEAPASLSQVGHRWSAGVQMGRLEPTGQKGLAQSQNRPAGSWPPLALTPGSWLLSVFILAPSGLPVTVPEPRSASTRVLVSL